MARTRKLNTRARGVANMNHAPLMTSTGLHAFRCICCHSELLRLQALGGSSEAFMLYLQTVRVALEAPKSLIALSSDTCTRVRVTQGRQGCVVQGGEGSARRGKQRKTGKVHSINVALVQENRAETTPSCLRHARVLASNMTTFAVLLRGLLQMGA